jgi:SAM-dependent methyltransferase
VKTVEEKLMQTNGSANAAEETNKDLHCPSCGEDVKLSFVMADEEKTTWIFCSCGTVFHQKQVDKAYFDEKYLNKYLDYKAFDERQDYLERLYVPLIEELTYGRRFLDVGFGSDYHLVSLRTRGWVTNGIDLIENKYIKGDFETYDFKNDRYDLILMGQVLGSFANPMKAIFKAKSLLMPNGVLMITAPDTDIMYAHGMFAFGNWNPKEKWVMFSENGIRKILESMNFKVILTRKDMERRLIGWNHYHVIAQKRFE